ncbi:hypothetical protein DPMN_020068 [Dreissena polymorpha]|uniref:Uncharacterized protein n=1 Tax=Dreissena polymorpha TaxID=45954 RepID=A0A9D4NKF5_DREPO|nr:hypothetical protein DPMN_020068 [Dreissena polymorpha]
MRIVQENWMCSEFEAGSLGGGDMDQGRGRVVLDWGSCMPDWCCCWANTIVNAGALLKNNNSTMGNMNL